MDDAYRFYTQLRVRFNETDAQGHVNFAWYLNYFDVALIEYLRALGYSYNDMLEEGFDMLYIDAHTAYKSAAYFDEVLRVHCRVGMIGNTSLRFDFQVFGEAGEREVAVGEIVVVIAKRDTYQKTRVPDRLRRSIEAYERIEA
jgi:acyl-CoA thioester hydrolase